MVIKDHKERMDHKDKRANRDQGECREHVILRYWPQDIWAFLSKGEKGSRGDNGIIVLKDYKIYTLYYLLEE